MDVVNPKKKRLLRDLQPLLEDLSFLYSEFDVVYNNYRRDTDGEIEFYVTRDTENIPRVGGIDWDGESIEVQGGEWGVHDALFPPDALTFDEFTTVVQEMVSCTLDRDDPAVDCDGDYMRVVVSGFGATPEDALKHEAYTAGESIARAKNIHEP